MSFPISPTNGQLALLNGITYTFNSTDNAWVRAVGALTATAYLAISDSTVSTSTTTGALTVTGGVGIGGNINFGGNLYQNGLLFTGSSTSTTSTFSIFNTTSSTSTTTGALTVTGGVGIGGNINFGGNLYQNGLLFTGSSTSTTSTFSIFNTTSSTSTTTGALTVTGGVGIGGNINFGGNLYQNGILFAVADPIVVNDISTQFDGVNTVFALRQNQTSINTIVDSKDLEVVINGARLTPYVKQQTYPWLVDYDSFKGFRVSGSNLIIYNAPAIGDSAAVIVRSISAAVQTRKYPYSATTIAIGD